MVYIDNDGYIFYVAYCLFSLQIFRGYWRIGISWGCFIVCTIHSVNYMVSVMISSRTIHFNETAFNAYVHQQIEPSQVIIRGSHRRHREVRKEYVMPHVVSDNRTQAELDEAQDEYLKSKGII